VCAYSQVIHVVVGGAEVVVWDTCVTIVEKRVVYSVPVLVYNSSLSVIWTRWSVGAWRINLFTHYYWILFIISIEA